MNLKLTRGHVLAEIWAKCLSLKEELERAWEMPMTIIEVTSINQLEGVGSMAGKKELIKEHAQLKEGAAVRFGRTEQHLCIHLVEPVVLEALHIPHSYARLQGSLFLWEHCYTSSQCEHAAVKNFTCADVQWEQGLAIVANTED